MTARWIAASLAVLALAGCHKKEADKPPPPKADTSAPPTTPSVTPPTASVPTTAVPATDLPAPEEPAYKPAPPPPGVTPTTSPDAPPTFIPAKPLGRIVIMRPPVKIVAVKPGGRPPPLKIVKTKAQVAAERDILGLWLEQKTRKGVLNFTYGGKVEYRETITTPPLWKGEWKVDPDGAVQFTLSYNNPSNPLTLTAYPTPAKIMAVAPHWSKEWGGSGQYAYERMH